MSMNIKPKLVALVVAAVVALVVATVVLLCVSALLFLPKHESQFDAITGNLSTVKPRPNPRFILSSGLRRAPDGHHDWNRTKYGLVWHWHITDVAVDDPREFYREIDLLVVEIYGVLALGSAIISCFATFLTILLWRRHNPRST